MYEDFGAIVKDAAVSFHLFFPDNTIDASQYQSGGLPQINSLRVTGNFQSSLGGADWDYENAPLMTKETHPNGWLYTLSLPDLPDGFYEYKYFVAFNNGTTRWCSDPCSKYGGFENGNSGFVVGGTKQEVVLIENRLPLKDLVIYEMMLDDFTQQFLDGRAPLDAVRDKLDYLQDLGINAIEFMPWTSWPDSGFSWGYNPVSFFSVEYRYYNDDAAPLVKLRRLQGLINEMHRRGIHVIMDGVFNHADAGSDPNKGFAYYWLYMIPGDCPFIGPFGDAGFFQEFNFSNNCTDQFIIDICTYWIKNYGIDGIRFDYVRGFYLANDPSQGIGEIILYLKKFTAASQLPNISFTLELLTEPRWLGIDETNTIDADGCWFDPLMWEGIRCVNEGKIAGEMMRALDAGRDFRTGKSPIVYIENHDHRSIVQACGGREQWWVTQPLVIALFTISGTVFLHNGQEFAEQYDFEETDIADNPRVQSRPLRWQRSTDAIGRAAYAFYKKLIGIRRQHPVLAGPHFYSYGAQPEEGTVIYHRWGDNEAGLPERYIIALNFSMFSRTVNIPFSENGNWENLLDGHLLQVENYSFNNYVLNSHWGAIFRLQQK